MRESAGPSTIAAMAHDALTLFLQSHQKDWRRISRATRGEHSPEDVLAEAWLMHAALRDKGVRLDLQLPDHRSLLISHLYQHLVRYTEQNVRQAVRLDHASGGDDGEAHPLAYLLAAEAHYDPVVTLMQAEEQAAQARQEEPGAQQSVAAAYLHLLRAFNHRMGAVAEHLMISLSYCYRRCAHARLLAVHQQALPASAMASDPGFMPGAWRPFRLVRTPVQLSINFDDGMRLFAAGD